MGQDSKIQWTDHTFNPWWGCARVSPGCSNCYAEKQAARFGVSWGAEQQRRFFGEKHWAEPLRWNARAAKEGKRARVFCASMADVFEDRRDLDGERVKVFRLIRNTPNLDWLLLTKRPEKIWPLLARTSAEAQRLGDDETDAMLMRWAGGAAPPNVWLGTTVEDNARAPSRLDYLCTVPAVVRFVSAEPLLEDVSGVLDLFLEGCDKTKRKKGDWKHPGGVVDWVIVGGESGPGARPFHLEWARKIIEVCRGRAAVFVKQIGAQPFVSTRGALAVVDARHPKGGEPTEWPLDLRIRELPKEGA